MFFFVSEPLRHPDGSASFSVGVATTIHCSTMSQAQDLSQRMRAALQALSRRGASPRRWPRLGSSVGEWVDELLQQVASAEPISLPRSGNEFELPKPK